MIRTFGFVYILTTPNTSEILGAFGNQEDAVRFANEASDVLGKTVFEAYSYRHGDGYQEWGLTDDNGNLSYKIVKTALMARGDCY